MENDRFNIFEPRLVQTHIARDTLYIGISSDGTSLMLYDSNVVSNIQTNPQVRFVRTSTSPNMFTLQLNGIYVISNSNSNEISLTTSNSIIESVRARWIFATISGESRVSIRAAAGAKPVESNQYLGIENGTLKMVANPYGWSITEFDSYNTDLYSLYDSDTYPEFVRKIVYTFLKEDVISTKRFPIWKHYLTNTKTAFDALGVQVIFSHICPTQTFRIVLENIQSSKAYLLFNNRVYGKSSTSAGSIETEYITHQEGMAYPMILLTTANLMTSLKIQYQGGEKRFPSAEMHAVKRGLPNIMVNRFRLVDFYLQKIYRESTTKTAMNVEHGTIDLITPATGFGLPTTNVHNTGIDLTYNNVLTIDRNVTTMYVSSTPIDIVIFNREENVSSPPTVTIRDCKFNTNIDLRNKKNLVFERCVLRDCSLFDGSQNITFSNVTASTLYVNKDTIFTTLPSFDETQNLTLSSGLNIRQSSIACTNIYVNGSTINSIYATDPSIRVASSKVHMFNYDRLLSAQNTTLSIESSTFHTLSLKNGKADVRSSSAFVGTFNASEVYVRDVSVRNIQLAGTTSLYRKNLKNLFGVTYTDETNSRLININE